MFTGLIEDVGSIVAVDRRGDHVDLAIRPAGFDAGELALGESIAVNGVCLTVTERSAAGAFRVTAGAETLAHTTIGELAPSSRVNLERALKIGERLGGHLVQGHVDGVGTLVGREDQGANLVLRIEPPRELLRYLAAKGSVAVDGISLTVNRVDAVAFAVALIPHTVSATALGSHPVGARVNLEVDIIAKYVERLTCADGARGAA